METGAVWDGRDFYAEPQPDGIYYYDVYLLVEREDEIGNGTRIVKR